MSNHRNDALESLKLADQYPNGWKQYDTSDLIAIAQVQATLALVDAQAGNQESKLAAILELCKETPIGLHGDYGPPVVLASAISDVIQGGK